MEKIVRYAKHGSFNSQFGYTNVYTFEDSDGKVYVWKTGSELYYNDQELGIGSILKIQANENGEREYRGVMQTKLTRVKVVKVIDRAPTWYDLKKERIEDKKKSELSKKQNMLKSISKDDVIWEMPYSIYKSKYEGYEVIPGSFKRYNDSTRWSSGTSTICVVIRDNNFGNTRKYNNYTVRSSSGKELTYRSENKYQALNFVEENFPEDTWEVV